MLNKIQEFGFKKTTLFAHYILAILSSIVYFGFCLYATNEQVRVFDIRGITQIYRYIIIYCIIVAVIVAIISIYESMQTMHKKDTKFDFIAFFIGFSMLITAALIIAAIVFMYNKELTETQSDMWKFLIGIFGSMFICQSSGGYLYYIFKKKYSQYENKTEETPKVEDNAITQN